MGCGVLVELAVVSLGVARTRVGGACTTNGTSAPSSDSATVGILVEAIACSSDVSGAIAQPHVLLPK